MCQKALSHERIRHSETKKNLNFIWTAHTRLEKIVSKVSYRMTASGEEITSDFINIAELMLELKAKAFRINDLENALMH